MRYIQLFIFSLFLTSVTGQELQQVNYNYQYNPGYPFVFDWKIVRQPDGWEVLYELEVVDSVLQTTRYGIIWETRQTIRDEEGKIFQIPVLKEKGQIFFHKDSVRQFLVAKVVNLKEKQAWIFYKYLSPNHPLDVSVQTNDGPIIKPYVVGEPVAFIEKDSATVFYYQRDFPPAAPPFSESLAQVSPGMKPDSIYTLSANAKTNPLMPGLYLIQKDTSSMNGFAFRVEDDYPKYRSVQNLIGPIQYICTKQEYQKLIDANGDKQAFDKVILGITGNKDRAKRFMKAYFTNVELANRYFTSYKEGWKTDRGMVYLILGTPSTVFKFTDREVWEYKTSNVDLSFTFVRSPTVFDPENYVLVRKQEYQLTWYEIVDLWRKARF